MRQDNIKKSAENRRKTMKNPRRLAISAFGLLLIVACAGADNASNSMSGTTLKFLESPAALDVTTVNPYPLAAAELVAPDGRFIKTDDVQRQTLRGGGGGSSIGLGGFGSSGGGFGTGIGIGIPLGGSAPGPSMIRSHTYIPFPDGDEYRRDWQRMVVRLRYGTPPAELNTVEMLAPAPVSPVLPPAK